MTGQFFPAVFLLESISMESAIRKALTCAQCCVVFLSICCRQPEQPGSQKEVSAIIKGLPATVATWQSPELPVGSLLLPAHQ